MSEKKNKILVIDDEKDILDLMTEILSEEGYEIETASDGAEGFEKMHQVLPELVILDMNMPGMSGMEVYYKIYNSAKQRPMFPVLAVTGRSDLESLFRELNVDGYMTKPFKVDALIEEVNLIFRKRYGRLPPQKSEPAIFGAKTPVPHKRYRILLVDEDAKLFGSLVTLFTEHGDDLLFANKAVQAMDILINRNVHAVLINLDLPDLPGDILVYKLKLMPRTMDIPIVLYSRTGNGAEVTRQIFERTGIRIPFLTKDPVGLCDECERILAGLREGPETD